MRLHRQLGRRRPPLGGGRPGALRPLPRHPPRRGGRVGAARIARTSTRPSARSSTPASREADRERRAERRDQPSAARAAGRRRVLLVVAMLAGAVSLVAAAAHAPRQALTSDAERIGAQALTEPSTWIARCCSPSPASSSRTASRRAATCSPCCSRTRRSIRTARPFGVRSARCR